MVKEHDTTDVIIEMAQCGIDWLDNHPDADVKLERAPLVGGLLAVNGYEDAKALCSAVFGENHTGLHFFAAMERVLKARPDRCTIGSDDDDN